MLCRIVGTHKYVEPTGWHRRPGDIPPYGQPQPPQGTVRPLKAFAELRREKDPYRRARLLSLALGGRPPFSGSYRKVP